MKTLKTLLQTIAVTALCAVMGSTANAQEKVRLAYLKTLAIVPFYHAQQMGYFKAEGIDLEMIPVQSGPVAASAIASGSADIAYAAPQIIITARAQQLPLQFVIGLAWEKIPQSVFNSLLASKRSGIKTIKDLVGKTILINAPGGACELEWRDTLAHNGIAWDQVKLLTAPFPQTQAMLELGTADAACTVEPFTTAIKQSQVDPTVLAQGVLVDQSHGYLNDGLFSTKTWAQNNKNTIAAMKRAIARATTDLKGNKNKLREILTTQYRLAPQLVEEMPIYFDFALDLKPADLEPVLSAMEKYNMVKPGLKASDLVADVK